MDEFSPDCIEQLRKDFSKRRIRSKRTQPKREFRRLAELKGISADKVDVSFRELYDFASFDM